MEKENLLSVINITTLRGLMYNLTDAIADARSGLSFETFFNAYNEDGSKNTAFTSEMMELWSQAKNADLTEEQLTRVERTSTHFYKWYYYYFPHASGKDRKAVYDYLVYLCNKFQFSVTAKNNGC